MADEDTSPTPPPAEEPTATPPEAATAPTEPQVTQSEPQPAEAQTAQIPLSEPLPVEPPPPREATAGQSEPITPATATVESPAEPAPEPASAPAQNSAPISTTVQHLGRDVLVKARAMIQARKKNKLEKIMEALNTNDPTTLKLRRAGEITNDEVEKLLHVSDATATRYLSALEKDGKIKQVGKTGIGVVYTKI